MGEDTKRDLAQIQRKIMNIETNSFVVYFLLPSLQYLKGGVDNEIFDGRAGSGHFCPLMFL